MFKTVQKYTVKKKRNGLDVTKYILKFGGVNLDIISNYDIQDPTSIPNDLRAELDANDTQLSLQFQNDLKGLVVGVPQEFYVDSLSQQALDVWRKGIQHLESLGAKIISVSIPHVSLALPAYYIIALAEASSNLARFDGIRYGNEYTPLV